MSDIYSFYQLISKYQIEIPIIQRDYAQGRDNTKAADVRKSIVKRMIDAVIEKEGYNPLFFDFIYGRIDGNKFIPFDGQQRLTTLFLFHKYVFEKCQSTSGCSHKDNCICKSILCRFSYATRQSSSEFCEKLVQEIVIPTDEIQISDYIKNQSWFYPDWQKDPTVMGMLTMLDEIHKQMKTVETFKTIAEKLTSGCNCPITYHFVDMGEHKLSDSTYVKMNARGKQLTPFENFKASLEQYLEEKSKSKDLSAELKAINKSLLIRWNGVYDKALQKYTGIDGTWLDLFWDVANKGNTGKELPDTLIMSFFNRHFINVWRYWYNTKSENERKKLSIEETNEQDCFNVRIQKEMPLYPTKDDFVSFDIYRYVIDNCGAEHCLIPIFNICDALYKDGSSIEKKCQAAWNREKEALQWNIYQGDKNNNNRETYPSRVAFYALMKYFKQNADTTSLSQWMHVVWNIIENSTIDSEEPYHAALRLINELSNYSHNIYAFLADENNIISSNAAQKQVKEERAKAKQILNGVVRSDNKTWEKAIEKAENFAFFKGAIRFLFQDADGNVTEDSWKLFDDKWGYAQMYFDENGVRDSDRNYRTDAILLKAVLYQVKDFWKYIEPQKYVFDNEPATWKYNILLEEGWESAVHKIMIGELDISERNDDCLIYKELYNTNLLNYVSNEQKGSRIRWIHDHRALYPPRYGGILLDDKDRNKPFYRNFVLSELFKRKDFDSGQKVENCEFFTGWDIYFSFKGIDFQWNTDEHVYLMENQKAKIREDNTPYSYDISNLGKDIAGFVEILEGLIESAYPNNEVLFPK